MADLTKGILGKPENGKCDECYNDAVVVLVEASSGQQDGGSYVCWWCIRKVFGMAGEPDWSQLKQMGR